MLRPQITDFGRLLKPFPTNLTNGSIFAAVETSDSLYIGGSFTHVLPDIAPYLFCIDATNAQSILIKGLLSGFNGQIYNLLANGNSLYVVGAFTNYNGVSCQNLAKLDITTGVIDPTFDTSTACNNSANFLLLDGNNLYIGGNFLQYKGITRQYLVKVDATTAALDVTFDTSTGANGAVVSIIKDNNLLYIGGNFSVYKGTTRQRIARIDANTASLDLTFDTTSGFSNTVQSMIKDNNDLYCCGAFLNYKGTTRQRVAKINTAAVLDATFDSASGLNNIAVSIIKDGSNLYLGGNFTAYKGTTRQYAVKINASTAALDATFDTTSGFSAVVNRLIKDGNYLYAGGTFTTYKGTARQTIAKINATDASLDSTFDTAVGFNTLYSTTVSAILKINNNLYCGGSFYTYKGTPRQNIAKFWKSDWSLDSTFDASSGFNGYVYDLLVDISTNTLYAGGAFTTYKSTARQYIARLNASNASLDASFDATTGFNANVYRLLLDNASLYVCGDFTTYKGTTRTRLAKLNIIDASLDATFDVVTGFDAYPYAIVKDGNDLYLCGSFSTYKGTARQRVIKLNAITAALDATFDSSTGFNTTAFNLVKDGNALFIVGGFTSYKSTTRNSIAKINATTAALDMIFDSSGNCNSNANGLFRFNNSLYVGGNFSVCNGSSRPKIAKLNSDTAVVDMNFDSDGMSTGLNGNVYTIAKTLINDGMYVFGAFRKYKYFACSSAVKVNLINAITII